MPVVVALRARMFRADREAVILMNEIEKTNVGLMSIREPECSVPRDDGGMSVTLKAEAVPTTRVLNKIAGLVVPPSQATDSLDLSCALINNRKQCHLFRPQAVDLEALTLELAVPGGRVAPLDESQAWSLVVQGKSGAYRTEVASLEVGAERVLCQLAPETHFLARRKSYRLAPDSRNPVWVTFHRKGRELRGVLVDFSLAGIGIQLHDRDELDLGDLVGNGVFQLRSISVAFAQAAVAHLKAIEGGWRAGLEFRYGSDSERALVQRAFDALVRSRPYSSSIAVDG